MLHLLLNSPLPLPAATRIKEPAWSRRHRQCFKGRVSDRGPRWRAVAVFQITSGAADIKIVFIYWLLYALTVAQITTLLFGDNRACVDLCCSVASGLSVHFSPVSIMSHEGNETCNGSFWKPKWVQVNIGRADEISGFEQSSQRNNLAKNADCWWGFGANASRESREDRDLSGREIGERLQRISWAG